jgi:predicted NBD/HSP70 family sugar kinase
MTGAVVNAAGEVKVRKSVSTGEKRGDAAETVVRRLATTLLESADRRVLGVGVGSPGVVDPHGMVIDAPNLGWHGVPLAARLTEALGVPTYVANDANTAALGEHTFGAAGTGGLMVLRVGAGVGAGLILEGSLLHGHRSAAGEIGHVVVDRRGEQCACGRTGCLETVLSVPHLRRRIAGLATAERARALAQTGRRLGAALAPVVGTLNLHELVLSGPADLLDGPLLDATATTIARSTMPVIAEELVVRTSTLGEDVVVIGASVLVLAGELGVS